MAGILNPPKIWLTNGNTAIAMEGQLFQWSETGKSIELWQEKPLRLIKRFNQSKILLADQTNR